MAITSAGRKALDALRLSQGLDESLPWGGRSPRVLTKAHERFRLSPRDAASKAEDDEVDEQYRRFLHGS